MTTGAFYWWFFIFPVYAVPTAFVFICAALGLIDCPPWWFWAWGGGATAFGIWIKETGMPCDQRASVDSSTQTKS